MKHLRCIGIICTIMLLSANIETINVFAEETTAPIVTTTNTENVTATGLIMTYSLQISGTSKKVSISGKTLGTDTMAKIGFINIEIQRSSNGSSGWTKELGLDDDIATNTHFHNKVSEQHNVAGGYYYRVKLDHYAKETGWWFPSSQTVTNYSNVVWVPAS